MKHTTTINSHPQSNLMDWHELAHGSNVVIDRPPVLTPSVAVVNKPALPPMYAVILHNDESTNPNFVINVLREIFGLEGTRARDIMMAAHTGGKATVAIYSREVAEAKHEQTVLKIARDGAGQNAMNRDQPCALTFTVEQETAGES